MPDQKLQRVRLLDQVLNDCILEAEDLTDTKSYGFCWHLVMRDCIHRQFTDQKGFDWVYKQLRGILTDTCNYEKRSEDPSQPYPVCFYRLSALETKLSFLTTAEPSPHSSE